MSDNDDVTDVEEITDEVEPEGDFEEPDLDDDDLDEEDLVDEVADDAFSVDDDVVVEEEDDEEEDDDSSRPRARKVDEEDDDDEEPEDVEADLEAILRDRMATSDDDDEEEEENAVTGVKPADVTSKRDDEFVCNSCFLVVNRSQFGTRKNSRCPVGDPDCPSVERVFG